jgi:hypothetical protein
MTLVVAGIDEAGYGPMLGPLCVAMAAFRIEGWSPEDGAPDLWKRLKTGVCRKPTDKRRRVAIDDSKKLKLPNDGPARGGRHPLTHLERGVLAFLGAMEGATDLPSDDESLLRALSTCAPAAPWYEGPSVSMPTGLTGPEARIASNLVRAAMGRERVGVAAVRCSVVGEAAFNEMVRAEGTKGATTGRALVGHLRWAWENLAGLPDVCDVPGGARIVCDRQGGRTQYAELIAAGSPGGRVEVLEESARASRYVVRGAAEGGRREMTVLFMPEAEKAHLPVALASMTAKLCRELCMARFNRYWSMRLPELKPTAGYYGDARRWLDDAAAVLSPKERAALVRLA